MKIARELVADMQSIQMLNRIPLPAILIAPDLLIAHRNEAFCKKFPFGDTLGHSLSLLDIINTNAQDTVSKTLQNYKVEDGVTLRFPFLQPGSDIALAPLKWEFNRGIGYLGVVKAKGNSPLSEDDFKKQVGFWKNATKHTSDATWEIDIVNDTSLFSPGWYELRGLAYGDSSRSSPSKWLPFLHMEDVDQVKATISEVLQGRLNSFELTYRERHVLGHWVWVHCYAHVSESTQTGQPLHIIGSEEDITQTKDNESKIESLSRLEERWRVAIESTQQGMWDHDRSVNTFYRSDQWYSIRGIERKLGVVEAVPRLLDRIHPDDKELVMTKCQEIDRGETETIEYEYRERHANGHWVWILRRGRVVARDEQGLPLRIIGTDANITDLRAQGKKYESLSKSLELAVTAAEIGVWEFDLHTQTEQWDLQMKKIYGFDANYVSDDRLQWSLHLHSEDRSDVLREFAHCLETGEDFNKDYRIIKSDGRVGYIRSRATLFKDGQGNGKLIGVNWDITKDRELSGSLEKANEVANKQNEALEAARSKMEFDALHDSLTGLANRRCLDEYQKRITLQDMKDGCFSAALHIDLDRFKQINDTLGHAAGDIVLVKAANILRQNAPVESLVARVGGDEFVIFINCVKGYDEVCKVAQNIIDAAQEPLVVEEKKCRFGMSVGIALGDEDTRGDSRLFANADLALYLAKHEGRNRYAIYTEQLKEESEAKHRLSEELLTALDQKQFFCLYQPQFDSETLNLSGVEALVRWRRPNGDVWAPDKFLDAAEELGIVAQIDQLVLEIAIEDMKVWDAANLQVPRMSVNVSAKRLSDPHLADKLQFLKDAPGAFAFELLETVFLDTYDTQLADNLKYIRDLGIDIEIDDFGTGHASIIGLLKLKPSRLKIDKELIKPIDKSETQRLLVSSIIQIGRLQNIAVVAEGVETPEHIECLRRLDCDYLQGYGLAGPMPAEQIKALLNAAQVHGRYSPFGV